MVSLWSSRKNRAAESRATTPERALQLVRVVHRAAASDGAVLLRLDSADPDTPLHRFPAGAHVDLHVRPGLVRQYSLVGAPGADDHYLVCVQREADGRGGSLAVHDELHAGTELEVSAPRSTFELVPSASSALLIGGGIGLTPLVSMAEHLHREAMDFEFHAYARNASALPLHDDLQTRPWAHRIHRHFSDGGDSFRSTAPPALSAPHPESAVYVCGPEGFINLARSRAITAGWPLDRIVSERFAPADSPSGAGTAFDVIAASTGERMTVGADETIADVLESRGYETYRSCGQGYCGSCVATVRSGIPDHRDDFQTDAQRASNRQINICVSRSLTPLLELDV